VGGLQLPLRNSIWLTAAIVEIAMTRRHNSTADGPIYMKLGRQMHTDMDDDRKMKPKPEVEFQHGGRLFSESETTNYLSRGLDVSLKFGLQVDFNLPKSEAIKTKP